MVSTADPMSGRDIRPPRVLGKLTKSFRFKVAVRLVGICFLGCVTGFLLFDSPYWMASMWTGLLTAALFYETVRFVNHSERKLTTFLQSIRQNDFTVTFSENYKSDDYPLHQAFNQLNDTFKGLRADMETQHQLLENVVAHTSVPLVCFDEVNEEVYLFNDAAKELFQVAFFRKLDTLRRAEEKLPDFLRSIRDGEKGSFKFEREGKYVFLSITSRHILFKDKKLKLIALTDVSSELSAREAEAWQKLLRVLTHEISNSAIPLSTLSSYITEMMASAKAVNRELSTEERTDVLESLKTIDHRSRTLKEFVQNFRLVGQVPDPRFERASLGEMMNQSLSLFTREFEKESIHVQVAASNDLVVHADPNLTQQVFINLLKNAMEAMENMKSEKVIDIKFSRAGHHYVNVLIADTGKGIPAEDLDQIFIPFFSTKKGGSGIGLSISRQIMQKQGGDLSVVSIPGKGSVFTASFVG